MSNCLSFCPSLSDGGADGAAGGERWGTLLRSLQRWRRQPLWGTQRGRGGDQQSKQTLDTPHILFLFIEHLLHRPPQLGLLLHPKRSQSVCLLVSGLSAESLRFSSPAAARAEDPPAGEEEEHCGSQRRRSGARRGRRQPGLPQPVIYRRLLSLNASLPGRPPGALSFTGAFYLRGTRAWVRIRFWAFFK